MDRKAIQRRILLICLLIAGLVLLVDHYSPLLVRLELLTLDWRFLQRGSRRPGPDVAMVTIDEKSLAELGKWPWPRSLHADLVEVLHKQGAALVVFDIFFAEPQDPLTDPNGDANLAAAMRKAGNVLLAAELPPEGTAGHGENAGQEAVEVTMERIVASDLMRKKCPLAPKPPPPWMESPSKDAFWTLPIPKLLEAARGAGYVDVPADPDVIFRRAVPARPVNNGCLYPHLALLAAALKLGVPARDIRADDRGALYLGRRRVPVSPQGTILIDFAGPPPSERDPSLYPRYSYSEVLKLHPRHQGRGKEMQVGQLRPDTFRGKIVFVGGTAPGLYDLRASPYSAVNVGVETNANLANAILQNRFFHQPGPWFLIVFVVAIGLGFGRLLSVKTMLEGTLITLAAGLGYCLLALGAFSVRRIILPMADPLLALNLCYSSAMAYRFLTEYRERLRNRAYLDLYVTRQVADRILSDPSAAMLGGQRVEVSVLFSDIRGFTTMSEAMRPEEVVAILNEYFDKTVPRIMEQEGTLDKYVGDAIMGVWGAPVAQPDHARRAVLAGLGMLEALQELHVSWRERGLPTFNIGIGINTGDAVAGNIGSSKRVQYTVIGDTVNTASRLESLNKEMGTNMLISESTYERVQDLVAVRQREPVLVKGKAEPLTVFEVLGLKGAVEEPVAAQIA